LIAGFVIGEAWFRLGRRQSPALRTGVGVVVAVIAVILAIVL
jgi:hypothetical protein